jgi:hypothetical protein
MWAAEHPHKEPLEVLTLVVAGRIAGLALRPIAIALLDLHAVTVLSRVLDARLRLGAVLRLGLIRCRRTANHDRQDNGQP